MMSAEQRDDLEQAIYRTLYDCGAVFDRDSVVPAVLDAVLELLRTPAAVLTDAAADVEEIDRIARTPKKDVTDEEFVRLARSPLFSLTLTRADLIQYLRQRASALHL